MSVSHGRVSRLASSCPKDFEFEFFVFQNEGNYPDFWSWKHFRGLFSGILDNTVWNIAICISVLLCLVIITSDLHVMFNACYVLDHVCDAMYVLNTIFMFIQYRKLEFIKKTLSRKLGLIVDVFTFFHYFTRTKKMKEVEIHHRYPVQAIFYYLRLHRPFRYLWTLADNTLKGSILATFLKYWYLFAVARLTVTICHTYSYLIPPTKFIKQRTFRTDMTLREIFNYIVDLKFEDQLKTLFGGYCFSFYLATKQFYPVGFDGDLAQVQNIVLCLVGLLLSYVLYAGTAVASISLVMASTMRPEQSYQARFRLIMWDMKKTKVPQSLSDKVETFYRMYWHKQRGVSVTQLLPLFPPTLPASIYTDIYFEAQQKSPILQDLSYQFLWELSKVMSTIHFIPGDAIIKRGTNKSCMIFITYGDVEMLTAEDDETAMLRMTRGTIVSPYAGAVASGISPSLVQIRAATFCTAHVVNTDDLWRVASKHGRTNGQSFILLSAFEEQIEKMKRHYRTRNVTPVKYKSTISQFKRNLIVLKDAKTAEGVPLLANPDYYILVSDSYLMRNSADANLIQESDAICLRDTFPCILQPNSSLLFVWNLSMALLISVVIFVHPYNIVYKAELEMEFIFFDSLVTLIFLMDILVFLSTADNVEEGVPITFTQASTRQLANVSFIVDLMATLPILNFIAGGGCMGLNKVLRVYKCFSELWSLEQMNIIHSTAFRFMVHSAYMGITCYFSMSLYQSYRCFWEKQCNVRNFTHAPYWQKGDISEDLTENNMLFGFYNAISIMTFTGFRDVKFQSAISNPIYLIVTYLLFEVSGLMNLAARSFYAANINVAENMENDYQSCIESVKSFLIRNDMDPMLRHRFVTYLQLCWFTDKAYAITHEKRPILHDLPAHVYQDIVARQRYRFIHKLPFTQYLNKESLREMSSHSRLFYTSPNEILMNTGDINNEICIITKGFCEVYHPDTKEVIDLIAENKYFGFLECMMRCPAFYTVRAVTHVQIISISRKHLIKILRVPKIRSAIQFIKGQREFKDLMTRRNPFMVYQEPPPAPNRQKFPLPRKHIPDSAFLYPFNRLGYFSILRYIFPRYTIRPDGKYVKRYEVFRGTMAMCSAMVFPCYTYLVLQWPGLYHFATFLDVTAYFDIVQRMLIGFFNEEGVLVSHPASTAAHYIKGAMIVDLVALCPFEKFQIHRMEQSKWYFTETDPSSANQVSFVRSENYLSTEVMQLLMLNRLLQLYRTVGAVSIFSKFIKRRDIIIVFKIIPIAIALINIATCLIIIHTTEIHSDTKDPWVILPTRLHRKGNVSWVLLFDHYLGFNISETPWNLQLATYFWMTYEIMTTGYGVYRPDNTDQLYIIVIAIFLGAMLMTYCMVVVMSNRSNVNQVLANYQEHMKDITRFMRRERLSAQLQHEVLEYYEYNWDKMGGLDHREVLKLCDQITLRTDAILHIYGPTFAKCPILFHCDISLLRVMGRTVYSQYFLKETTIISQDEIIEDLYIVDFGSVDMVDYRGEYRAVTKLGKGSVFGNLDNVPTARCPTAFVATNDLHLLKINSTMFHTVIADFPTIKILMMKWRPNKENFIVGSYTQESGPANRKGTVARRASIVKISVQKSAWLKNLYMKSRVSQTYLVIVSLACILTDVYNAGFQSNQEELIMFLYALDAAFLLKIFVYLVIPMLVEDGEGGGNIFKASRKEYINEELKSDIFSCLPFELISMGIPTNKKIWFSCLRLNRLARIVTVYKCMERHKERLSVNMKLTTLVSVVIWVTVYVHCMTCMWYALGEVEHYRNPGGSWLSKQHVNETVELLHSKSYSYALVFVFTTFLRSGTDHILPKQHSEVIFTIFMIFVGTVLYDLVLGEFNHVIQYQQTRTFKFHTQYRELQDFLKNNRVSSNLVMLVNRYSLHLWRESRGLQLPHFLETAPQCLKLKLMCAAYLVHLENHIYFKYCEPAFLRQLAGCMRLYTYCSGVFVVKESEITDAMYLIHRGRVQEVDEDLEEELQRETYFDEGQYFGLSQGLVRDTPYTYSYRTTTQSQVLTLQLDSWEYLLQHFPVSRYAIYKHIPGHPYNKNPQEAQTAKKADFFNAPKTTDDDDNEKKESEDIAITRKARRSTIYGSFLPYAKPTDEEILNEDKDDKAEEVSLGSDASISLDNLQTGPSLQQFGEFLQVGHKKEEASETEESEEEEEEVTFKVQRRETIFQRLANKITGKTDTDREENARKDTLLIEEEMAATNELLSTLKAGGESGIRNTIIMEDESKSTKAGLTFIPGFVQDEKEIEARKDADEDEELFISKRKERLSFLPGLVQSQSTPEKIPMSKGPRRSILPGLAEKKSKEEGEEVRKLPRLSFLPGLIQTDDKGNIIDIKSYEYSPKATTSKGKSTEPSPGELAKSYEFEKLPEVSLKIHDDEEEPKIEEDIEMKTIGSLKPKQTTVDEKSKDIELQEIRIDVPEAAEVPYKEDKGHLQEIRIDAPEIGKPKQEQSPRKSMPSFMLNMDDDEQDIETDLAPDSPFPIMRPLHSRKSRAVAKDEEEAPRRTSSGESTPEKKKTEEESPKDK